MIRKPVTAGKSDRVTLVVAGLCAENSLGRG